MASILGAFSCSLSLLFPLSTHTGESKLSCYEKPCGKGHVAQQVTEAEFTSLGGAEAC